LLSSQIEEEILFLRNLLLFIDGGTSIQSPDYQYIDSHLPSSGTFIELLAIYFKFSNKLNPMASTHRKQQVLKKRNLPTLLLLGILLISVAFAPGQVNSALDGLVRDLKKEKEIVWELLPENENHISDSLSSPVPGTTKNVLKMRANGTFDECGEGQILSGLWTIDERSQSLVLLYKSANGYVLQGENPPVRYVVESYKQQELVLIWEGSKASIRKSYQLLPVYSHR